jgi:hypothetical protein
MQDVTGGVNKNGTKLQMRKCLPGDANQQWSMTLLPLLCAPHPTMALHWYGKDKCLVSDIWFQPYANLFVNRS